MELSPARKRVFHLHIAHALETRVGSSLQLGAVLAKHYEKAGETQSAFYYWLRAGDYASQISSQSGTYSAYRQAESLAKQPDLLLPEQAIYQLYSNWGEVLPSKTISKPWFMYLLQCSKLASNATARC